MNKNILVGGAWPYANGSLHIGHIAALLPADVIARYHRAKGDHVVFVSGSDCHGTPVAIRAKQEGKSPEEISNFYHEEFTECFEKLGFSYDLYTKTSDENHKTFVKRFHKKLYESPYVYEKEVPQAYCENCAGFLADRFVTGKCPDCGEETRGDQCDACGNVLEPEQLLKPVCAVCKRAITFRTTKHLYIAISKLEKELREFVDSHPEWRKNAIAFSERYINEGLRDRALTRDLEWGIEVPKEGYEDKKIYIWAENVLGYLSAAHCLEESNNTTEVYKDTESLHYYVHGKDNIPFHTIILPSLLLANGEGWHLPDRIISSEYLTLEGKKISTSRNYAVWIKDIVNNYQADSLRYYLLANGPEKKDADFSWREFVNSHNGELLGAYGNFINRSLAFIEKYLGSFVPDAQLDTTIQKKIEELYGKTGEKIEKGQFKDAVDEVFEFVRWSNKYFDECRPWITRTEDIKSCENTLFQCVQIIVNLAVVLQPFLPFSSEKVLGWFELSNEWKPQYVSTGFRLGETGILFKRLDKEIVDIETEKLKEITE